MDWLKNILSSGSSGLVLRKIASLKSSRKQSFEQELAATDPNSDYGRALMAMLQFVEKALEGLARNECDAKPDMKEICSFGDEAINVIVSGGYHNAPSIAQLCAVHDREGSHGAADYASVEMQMRIQQKGETMPISYPDFRLLDKIAEAAGIKVLRTDEDAFWEREDRRLQGLGHADLYPCAVEFSPEGKRIVLGMGRVNNDEHGFQNKKDFGMESELIFHSADIPRLLQTISGLKKTLEAGHPPQLPVADKPKLLR